ncbi:MAG: FKBP-type peptidyl-prolyl cis-trans isomerase [Spirochaetaceae bacterium]|nr:FKBP-type peptidyl-prolyl cis-trans isomerase [Spirochaetaceae bacterium]
MVDAIQQGDRIEKVTIVRNGSEAAAFKGDQAAFDELVSRAKTASLEKSRAKREADIAEIKEKYPDSLETPSGLRYRITREGTGAKPNSGQTVSMGYKGMFLSGQVFDASDIQGRPLEFRSGSGQIIPGIEETVQDMRLGEKRLVVIPPELAYGEQGAGGGLIPGDTFLVFEIELVEIR